MKTNMRTELPQRWAIKITSQNANLIDSYIELIGAEINNVTGTYMTSIGDWIDEDELKSYSATYGGDDFEVITDEEFMRFVYSKLADGWREIKSDEDNPKRIGKFNIIDPNSDYFDKRTTAVFNYGKWTLENGCGVHPTHWRELPPMPKIA